MIGKPFSLDLSGRPFTRKFSPRDCWSKPFEVSGPEDFAGGLTAKASATFQALVVHPDPETLRELSWLPGWRICLCTPAWPDGKPCELSSRETLKGALMARPAAGQYAEAARKLGMAQGAVVVAAHRLRGRYRKLLRDEIASAAA